MKKDIKISYDIDTKQISAATKEIKKLEHALSRLSDKGLDLKCTIHTNKWWEFWK